MFSSRGSSRVIPGTVREAISLARTLQHLLALILMGLGIGFLTSRQSADRWRIGIAFAGIVIALVYSLRGHRKLAVRISIATMLYFSSALAISASDGVRSIAILIFPGVLVVAALLLDPAWYLGLAVTTVIIVTGIGLREMTAVAHGQVMTRSATTYRTVIQIDCILAVVAAGVGLLGRNLRASLVRTRHTVEQLDQAVKELRESEERFRTLVDLAVDAIFITGRGGVILDVNQRACTLTGRSKQELLSVNIAEVFSCGNQFVLADDNTNGDTAETEVLRPNDSRIGVELHWNTMPSGVVQIICRDITERRRTEARIRQMQKMESVGRLAGGVAHDFNNLLTVINGYSGLLLERMDPKDRALEAIREIHNAARNAAGLTQQLLTFSRKQDPRPQPVDLAELVDSSLIMLRRLLGEDIEVLVEHERRPVVVLADPVQMHQVLVNLAVNARDAMPSGGKLTISTATLRLEGGEQDSGEAVPGEYAAIAVSDTGTGMTEEVQRRIFEPFFTTKEVGRGTGLGLATIYGIVQQSKGFIKVESQLGQGSRFTACLPRAASEVPVAAKKAPARQLPGKETLLVAEDQEAVRRLTTAILRASGYRVLTAADGEEALKLVQLGNERIDLVLTDVVMPRMNGRELVERVLEVQPGVKAIYVSGYSYDLLASKNLPAGIHVLAKPYDPETLTATVRKVLDGEALSVAS